MRKQLSILSILFAAGFGSSSMAQAPKTEGGTPPAGGGAALQKETEPRREAEPRRGRLRAAPPAPDWPRAGGFGPERPMAEGLAIETIVLGDAIRRELTDALQLLRLQKAGVRFFQLDEGAFERRTLLLELTRLLRDDPLERQVLLKDGER